MTHILAALVVFVACAAVYAWGMRPRTVPPSRVMSVSMGVGLALGLGLTAICLLVLAGFGGF